MQKNQILIVVAVACLGLAGFLAFKSMKPPEAPPGAEKANNDCPRCNATGQVGGQPCPVCLGSKKMGIPTGNEKGDPGLKTGAGGGAPAPAPAHK